MSSDELRLRPAGLAFQPAGQKPRFRSDLSSDMNTFMSSAKTGSLQDEQRQREGWMKD